MRLGGLRLFLGGDERNDDCWLSELALCKSPARAPGVALNRCGKRMLQGGAEQAIGEWPGRGKWILLGKKKKKKASPQALLQQNRGVAQGKHKSG